ncbi:hypothetical protein E2C00_18100 [Streptomyces sp. WAC05374]|uniref:hypothetical protein n=1 Tax=Streptomyces sp. WAC05374 TaxID=2487420 RepID=UPI000F867936|nr:hypothetical protein [Streptomyces sp. WAC05374]RST14148.1 hypothetical protein EF905_18245 [Streptomyces sp. WAC05374]TDF54794.1 hypothetical protein E2C00_18100 [Streptomyces sp. WAC05374]TDF56430.1 hypothetical protein E2C02_13555 [Streptomyces sp. WAC05374]
MPSHTAEELLANVHGLTPERAQQLGDQIDECRQLLDTNVDMDTVQQHLKDKGVSIIHAILTTTRLRAAREIVECSPARTHSTA